MNNNPLSEDPVPYDPFPPEFSYMQLKDIIMLPRKIKRSRDVIFNI